MRLDTVDYRSSQSDQRKSENEATQQYLMTPARRAALAALEREFNEFLKAARASGMT
jgi:hypothetical protein